MLVSFLISILTVTLTAAPALTAEEAAALIPAVTISAQCNWSCLSCPDPDEHAMFPDFGSLYSSHSEPCSSGGDCDDHECPVPAPADDDDDSLAVVTRSPVFWQALATSEPAHIRTFLANNQDVASYNPGRRSIQVLGCGGQLIANVPLTSEQIAGLDP